jgi:hypothetical protein
LAIAMQLDIKQKRSRLSFNINDADQVPLLHLGLLPSSDVGLSFGILDEFVCLSFLPLQLPYWGRTAYLNDKSQNPKKPSLIDEL